MRRMTWDELADRQRAMAHYLMTSKDPRFVRGVCSRAYYAAYALVTARLPESTSFGRGWRNPEHARLPGHVGRIAGLGETNRQAVRRALRRLRQRREDADYRPGATVDRAIALKSINDVAAIFDLLRGDQ